MAESASNLAASIAARDWSSIHGFDYQPSYGANGLEIWSRFDHAIVRAELSRGRDLFPGMNMIRIWLSWEAFRRDGARFLADLDAEIRIAADLELDVMPVLFNRWHVAPDFGGVYADQFLPGSIARADAEMDAYVDAVVGAHAADPRILAWDLCNEPFFDSRAWEHADWVPPSGQEPIPSVVANAELTWLRRVRDRAKSHFPIQPVTIAAHGALPLATVDEFSDILSIHPYWVPTPTYPSPFPTYQTFERLLDEQVNFARQVGKQLLATECCLGREDDEERVRIIKGTLGSLAARGIGWVPHLLNHSLVADAFPSSYPGYTGLYMAFIDAEGELRPGHDVYNRF